MIENLLSIGEVSRASGLSPSALRFYDREGLLPPSHVDPDTGYRWYSPERLDVARLVAELRRVGLPVAEIATVLAHDDERTASAVLDAHLHRLEEGLEAARGAVARLRGRWRQGMVQVEAAALAGALDRVRYAAGGDRSPSPLRAVLLESRGDRLRLWATDRYRLATETVPLARPASSWRGAVPLTVLDELRPLLTSGPVDLEMDGELLRVANDGEVLTEVPVDRAFPELDHVLHQSPRHDAVVTRAEIISELRREPDVARWRLDLTGDRLRLSAAVERDDAPADLDTGADLGPRGGDDGGLLLDAEFLSQAVASTDAGQLRLTTSGPIAPLAIAQVDAAEPFSVIMPIRPDAR